MILKINIFEIFFFHQNIKVEQIIFAFVYLLTMPSTGLHPQRTCEAHGWQSQETIKQLLKENKINKKHLSFLQGGKHISRIRKFHISIFSEMFMVEWQIPFLRIQNNSVKPHIAALWAHWRHHWISFLLEAARHHYKQKEEFHFILGIILLVCIAGVAGRYEGEVKTLPFLPLTMPPTQATSGQQVLWMHTVKNLLTVC